VVSRSGENDGSEGGPNPEGKGTRLHFRHPERPGEDDGAEVTVHLKVSYKTLLLVVVVFDLVHLSLREFFDASWFQQLLGLG